MAHQLIRVVSVPLVFLAGAALLIVGTRVRRRPAAVRREELDELAESESSWVEWRGTASASL